MWIKLLCCKKIRSKGAKDLLSCIRLLKFMRNSFYVNDGISLTVYDSVKLKWPDMQTDSFFQIQWHVLNDMMVRGGKHVRKILNKVVNNQKDIPVIHYLCTRAINKRTTFHRQRYFTELLESNNLLTSSSLIIFKRWDRTNLIRNSSWFHSISGSGVGVSTIHDT